MDLDELQTEESEPEAAAVAQEEETVVEVQSSWSGRGEYYQSCAPYCEFSDEYPWIFGNSRLFAE